MMFKKIFKFRNYYIFKACLQEIEIKPKKPILDFDCIEINSLKEFNNLIINNYKFDNPELIEYYKRLVRDRDKIKHFENIIFVKSSQKTHVKNPFKLITEVIDSILQKKTSHIGEKNQKIFLYFLWALKHYTFSLFNDALDSILQKKTSHAGEKNLKVFLYFQDNFLIHVSGYSENKPCSNIFNKLEGKNSVFIEPVFTSNKFRGKGIHVYDMVCRINEYKLKGFKYIYGSSAVTNMESVFCFLNSGFRKDLNVSYFEILKFRLFKRYRP